MLIKVESREAPVVARALHKQIVKLPAPLPRSLTWDRGHEMAEHASFTVATGVQVYFCDPQSPWQCGPNENTNRLLRQYFPKRTPLGDISQQKLNAIAKELSERARKTLNFETPAERLSVALSH